MTGHLFNFSHKGITAEPLAVRHTNSVKKVYLSHQQAYLYCHLSL